MNEAGGPLPGGGAARLALCVERLVCRVLFEELVEADAVAVIFGACLAQSLNVEELFVLFKKLQILVGDKRGNSLSVAADEGTFALHYVLRD